MRFDFSSNNRNLERTDDGNESDRIKENASEKEELSEDYEGCVNKEAGEQLVEHNAEILGIQDWPAILSIMWKAIPQKSCIPNSLFPYWVLITT